jgi:hypothetical protein
MEQWTYADILQQMLADCCPSNTEGDLPNPDYREFVIRLHCGTVLVKANFVRYNKETNRFQYDILSVTFGCESMEDGCDACESSTITNIVKGERNGR